MPTHNTLDKTGVTLATTDATPTVAATVATRSDEAYIVTATVIATETADYDEAGGYVRIATFNNDGGTLAIVGAETSVATHESTAGWDVALSASGTNIVLTVTGAAATAVTWRVDLKVNTVGWKSVQELNAP